MDKGERIKDIIAREVFDSRGNPTVEVNVLLECGIVGCAIVPSGASTGSREALELRDRGDKRMGGKGVLNAVKNIREKIAKEISGISVFEQTYIDMLMVELDGTRNKSKLGANAILGVSLAVARSASLLLDMPLFSYIGGIGQKNLPIPMMNVINGGLHSDNKLDVQEFMIVPVNFRKFRDALCAGIEVFHSLKSELKGAGKSISVGDEGGFAPDLKTADEAIEILIKSIERAGYKNGQDVFIALDVASSNLFNAEKGLYEFRGAGRVFKKDELMEYYNDLISAYHLISIEDPFSEDDAEGWIEFSKVSGQRVQIVADDVFVTNPEIIKDGIRKGIANAVLIKVNQIGTLTETLSAIELSRKNSYNIVISHRSGETEDTFISDLAAGVSSEFIKTGAPSRSERVAKYNQLLRIEEKLGEVGLFHGNSVLERFRKEV